jgi:hypothetical protein
LKNYLNRILYSYKGIIYEELPFNNYLVIKEVIKDNTTIIYISRDINIILHIFIIIFLLLPIIFVYNYINNVNSSEINHIIQIPNEIYYNKENNIIDLDITNSIDNCNVVKISLLDSENNIIIESLLLNINETLGGIKINKELNSLPISCKIKYSIILNNSYIKTIYKDVLLIDSINLKNNINNDF